MPSLILVIVLLVAFIITFITIVNWHEFFAFGKTVGVIAALVFGAGLAWIITWAFTPAKIVSEKLVPIEIVTYQNGDQEQVARFDGKRINILEKFNVYVPKNAQLKVVSYEPTTLGIYDMDPNNHISYELVR